MCIRDSIERGDLKCQILMLSLESCIWFDILWRGQETWAIKMTSVYIKKQETNKSNKFSKRYHSLYVSNEVYYL